MYQGRRSYLGLELLLLVASAVQGMTPDAQDLSSLNSLRVLCPFLVDSGVLPDDDGLPDEICSPSTSELKLVCRLGGRSTTLPFFGLASIDCPAPAFCASTPQRQACDPALARIHTLVSSSCRLNC
jgi:hypothetical protein